MIIRTSIGVIHGRPLLEYIPENEEDRQEIHRMMVDGEIPSLPSQKDPPQPLPHPPVLNAKHNQGGWP